MELVASLPKPHGFFDPKMPAGEPTEPGTPEHATAKPAPQADDAAAAAGRPPATPPPQPRREAA